jgi:hypothetical protein
MPKAGWGQWPNVDLLAVWAGSDKNRNLILVDNPAKLYGF